MWKKMQAGHPAPEEAKNVDRPWVQRFEVPGGELAFNHLTAGLMHLCPLGLPFTLRSSSQVELAQPHCLRLRQRSLLHQRQCQHRL